MGIFSNYEKAGPGVSKNAPKKRGIFLYFELLWRYLWKVIQSNLLYVTISLPVLVLYHYLFLCVFGTSYGPDADIAIINGKALTMTVMLAVFWGTGPASCGFTCLLRGMAREEHVWISLDFFKKAKESFKHGLVFLLVDITVFAIVVMSLSVYAQFSLKSDIYMVPMIIIIIALALYTAMHFFMYEFEITFENSIKEVYKNSLIMTIATLPMCILIGGIICLLSYFVLGILPNTGIVIIAFLFWVAAMRFVIDFYSARLIKKRFLKKSEESEK